MSTKRVGLKDGSFKEYDCICSCKVADVWAEEKAVGGTGIRTWTKTERSVSSLRHQDLDHYQWASLIEPEQSMIRPYCRWAVAVQSWVKLSQRWAEQDFADVIEGSPTNRLNPLPAHAYPTKIFSVLQSLWKILQKKKIQIIENTRNIPNITLIFRFCGVEVSKIQVEREGGLGVWWVIPSSRMVFWSAGSGV